MISNDTIFCVSCSSVVDREKAEIIFQTGFYKVSMQLGICSACESNENLVEEASRIDPLNQYKPFVEGQVQY